MARKKKNKAAANVNETVDVNEEVSVEVTPPEAPAESIQEPPVEGSIVEETAEVSVPVVEETAEVSVPVAEETKVDSDIPKQPHEEAMDKFDVNPEESYDGTSLKMIPKEWYAPIIRLAINQNSIKPISTVPNDNLFSVVFDALDKAAAFEESFGVPVINCINKYITDVIKENPKEYQRALVIETQVNSTVVTIAF